MGENEINLLMTVMRDGFNRVEGAIETSRKERQDQVGRLHTRINDIAEHGCAHRPQHEKEISDLKAQLRRTNEGSSLFGTIQLPKLKAVGLSAIIIAMGVCYAIAKTCKWL